MDVLDELQETDYYSLLYKSDGSVNDELLVDSGVSSPSGSSSLFVVERLEVLPQYRGRGFGEIFISEGHRLFGGRSELLL